MNIKRVKWQQGVPTSAGTLNPNLITDENGEWVCAVYGIPTNGTLEELKRSNNGSDREGMKQAELIIAAVNSFEAAKAAMKSSLYILKWFEPFARVPETREQLVAAIAQTEAALKLMDEKPLPEKRNGMKVKLTYFKDSGKYYSSGEYETSKKHIFEIFTEVRELVTAGKLPGLVEGARFHTLVDVPEHEHNHQAMIFLEGPR